MNDNYSVSIDIKFMRETKKEILDKVKEKVSWRTEIFKKKANIDIFVSNHTLSPDGEVKVTFGVRMTGVKTYPYQINSYPEFVIDFLDAEGNFSVEIHKNSLEKTVDDFLSYLYALEKELTNE